VALVEKPFSEADLLTAVTWPAGSPPAIARPELIRRRPAV
jgi:hypothetical protein